MASFDPNLENSNAINTLQNVLIASAVLFTVSAVALGIIYGLNPHDFCAPGNYPLLGTLGIVGGVSLTSFIICSVLRCRRNGQTEPAVVPALQQPQAIPPPGIQPEAPAEVPINIQPVAAPVHVENTHFVGISKLFDAVKGFLVAFNATYYQCKTELIQNESHLTTIMDTLKSDCLAHLNDVSKYQERAAADPHAIAYFKAKHPMSETLLATPIQNLPQDQWKNELESLYVEYLKEDIRQKVFIDLMPCVLCKFIFGFEPGGCFVENKVKIKLALAGASATVALAVNMLEGKGFSKRGLEILSDALSTLLPFLADPLYDAINISPFYGEPHPLAPALKDLLKKNTDPATDSDTNMQLSRFPAPTKTDFQGYVTFYIDYFGKLTTAIKAIGMQFAS